jgi:hypothetical protein
MSVGRSHADGAVLSTRAVDAASGAVVPGRRCT